MEYLPLKDYEKLARKILVCSFKRIAAQVIKDNDKFGMVVEELIKADWKYNPDKYTKPPHTISLEGYRKQRILWILDKLLKRDKNITRIKSIDNHKSISITGDTQEVDFMDSFNDLCERIKDDNNLSPKEQICAEGYFINKLDIDDLADNLGIKRQSVKTNLKKAIVKLGVYDEYIGRLQNRRQRGKTS